MHILVVCRANICRSPFAAACLSSALEGQFSGVITVDSAGTHPAHATPCCDRAITKLHERNRSPGRLMDHAPRGLTETLILSADLILTMGESHRAAVIGCVPAARDRTFTLVEARLFAQAARTDTPVQPSPANWAKHLNEMRGFAAPASHSFFGRSRGNNIEDGHSRPARAHGRVLDLVDRESRLLTDALHEL